MSVPAELKYTKEHEWIRVNGKIARVGITRFAADQLGDIVFVEMPPAGKVTRQMEVLSSIESVKAVSDIYSPVSGKVTQANTALSAAPEKVNSDPYGEGWIVEIELSNPAELSALLSASDYESHTRDKK